MEDAPENKKGQVSVIDNRFAISISPSEVIAATEENFIIYIENVTSEPIIFNNKKQIPVEKFPDINAPYPKETDGIYIYSSYGTKDCDLTTEEDSIGIKLEITGEGNKKWGIQVRNDFVGKKGIHWVLVPKEKVSIEAGQAITLSFSNVILNQYSGNPKLHFRFIVDGTKKEGTLFFIKLQKPQIITFQPVETEYFEDESINMAWKIKDLYGYTVSFDKEQTQTDVNTGLGTKRVLASEEKHCLQILWGQKEVARKQCYMPVIQETTAKGASNLLKKENFEEGYLTLDAIETNPVVAVRAAPYEGPSGGGSRPPAPPPKEKNITVSWKTLHTQKCILNDKTVDVSGEKVLTVPIDTDSILLKAYAEDGSWCVKRKILL